MVAMEQRSGAETDVRVLIVDDDKGMVATLRDILGATGYEVDVAYSGNEAMERVREQPPDGILMDIRMPGLNGIEAFREIRRLSPDSFVIFMTAYSASSLVDDARREGAIEVLPKPLDLERVLHLLNDTAAKTPLLVVDDNSAFCTSLSESLAAHSFDVRVAHGVEEALALFEREPRRVVILDMRLEGRTGLEVLQSLKQVNPQALVVLMTGFTDLREDMEKGLTMNASAYLTKPFAIEDLVGTIRQAIARRGKKREPGFS